MDDYVDYTLSKVEDRSNTFRFDVDTKTDHIGHMVFEIGPDRQVRELELTPDPNQHAAVRQALQRIAVEVASDVRLDSED